MRKTPDSVKIKPEMTDFYDVLKDKIKSQKNRGQIANQQGKCQPH